MILTSIQQKLKVLLPVVFLLVGCLAFSQHDLDKVSVFPNPGKNVMNVELSSLKAEALQLEVFNVLGDKVLSRTISRASSSVDISQLTSGLYLVRFSSLTDNESHAIRFVKQ